MNRGVGEAAADITAGLTTDQVEESQRAARDLARMSSDLQALVGAFRT
jgi:methyl-accepting chemotaxis protein